MRKIDRDISREDFISRIPGLFACVGTEGDDSGILHPSSDYIDGCYGHVPANVRIQENCDVYVYKEIEEQQGVEYNTINSVPVVCDSTYPKYVKTVVDETEERYYERVPVMESGDTVNYATLMHVYREYKGYKAMIPGFVSFAERGIGKVDVIRPEGLEDVKAYDLIPDTLYLSQVTKLYNEYLRLSLLCSDKCGGVSKEDKRVCCECDRYKRMGGDVFMEYLHTLMEESMIISEEFYNNSASTNYIPNMTLNLCISASTDDMGYSSCYVNELVFGQPVYDGDIVTYNDRSYVCKLNSVKIKDYYGPSHGDYGLWLQNNYEFIKVKDTIYRYDENGSYVEYHGYDQGTVASSTSGYFNPETMRMEFDEAHFILLSDYVTHIQQENNMERNGFYYDSNTCGTSYLYGDVDPQIVLCSYSYVAIEPTIEQKELAVEKTSLPAIATGQGGDMVVYPEYVKISFPPEYVYYRKVKSVTSHTGTDFDSYEVSGYSDSKLVSLRRFVNYLNDAGFTETPQEGEDWLYYYKKGYVTNIRLSCDELGNIRRFSDTPVPDGMVTDLIAYGDVITDMSYDDQNRNIRFEYTLGAHLTAMHTGEDVVDGNTLHYYSDFKYDTNSDSGIKYTEIYNYNENSEIATLISHGDFDDFVNADTFENLVASSVTPGNNGYYYMKFPFSTVANNSVSVISILGDDMTFNYRRTSFSATTPNRIDNLMAPTFKKDEFMGISYEPEVHGTIRIDRGNGASFERHMKLGDVMTVDAMENYSNGGFFNIISTD